MDLFVAGQGGYDNYRIPAIVRSAQGTLLAFCEARTGGDSGPIDLVLKRSTDNGATWGPLQVVWDDGDNTCGNPCPVLDQNTGAVWLLMTWNLGTDHERTIMAGTSQQPRRVYVTSSRDEGVTWERPRDISASTRKPHWRWYATGPGNAIQLTRGAHAGRLLIPCNHSDHEAEGHPYRSHVIYSDDQGVSWLLGGVQEDRTNESSLVERSDGSVLQLMRSYHGRNRRAMSISEDGGLHWGEVYLDESLDTPVCQANALRHSWADPANPSSVSRILFSSPWGGERKRLAVWSSVDEGRSWPVRRVVHAGNAAYSNLVNLGEGRIGLLFERDGYAAISLARFSLDWLEAGDRDAR
jgi:sialidase-1